MRAETVLIEASPGEVRGALMRAELQAIMERGSLSDNLLECVEKSLA